MATAVFASWSKDIDPRSLETRTGKPDQQEVPLLVLSDSGDPDVRMAVGRMGIRTMDMTAGTLWVTN